MYDIWSGKIYKRALSSMNVIFLKGSIVQIYYIDMEYSIGLNFVFDKEFFKYHIFEELYGALFSIDMEYSTR